MIATGSFGDAVSTLRVCFVRRENDNSGIRQNINLRDL